MMGLNDMPTFWSILLALFVPLQLLGISGSWIVALIQFSSLATLLFIGTFYVKKHVRRILFFSFAYPAVTLATNIWPIINELSRH